MTKVFLCFARVCPSSFIGTYIYIYICVYSSFLIYMVYALCDNIERRRSWILLISPQGRGSQDRPGHLLGLQFHVEHCQTCQLWCCTVNRETQTYHKRDVPAPKSARSVNCWRTARDVHFLRRHAAPADLSSVLRHRGHSGAMINEFTKHVVWTRRAAWKLYRGQLHWKN